MTDITRDRFLGGRVILAQPRRGYRAGSDPVFLAAAVQAQSGESVLELGCGAGAALLALGARVPGLALWGAERDPGAARLARDNATANGTPATIVEADVAALPPDLKARSFDHVMTNPPFLPSTSGPPAADAGREAGRREATPIDVWIDVAIRRLGPKGRLTVIWPAARLPEMLNAIGGRLGGVHLQPLAPRHDRAAEIVLLTAKKDSRSAARLLPPLVLHAGPVHDRDRDSYTDSARAILRDGAALDWSRGLPSGNPLRPRPSERTE